jgi:hypothetical protein
MTSARLLGEGRSRERLRGSAATVTKVEPLFRKRKLRATRDAAVGMDLMVTIDDTWGGAITTG